MSSFSSPGVDPFTFVVPGARVFSSTTASCRDALAETSGAFVLGVEGELELLPRATSVFVDRVEEDLGNMTARSRPDFRLGQNSERKVTVYWALLALRRRCRRDNGVERGQAGLGHLGVKQLPECDLLEGEEPVGKDSLARETDR